MDHVARESRRVTPAPLRWKIQSQFGHVLATTTRRLLWRVALGCFGCCWLLRGRLGSVLRWRAARSSDWLKIRRATFFSRRSHFSRYSVRTEHCRYSILLQSIRANDQPRAHEEEDQSRTQAETETEENGEARDSGALAANGEEENAERHDQDEKELDFPLGSGGLNDVLTQGIDERGIRGRTGLSGDVLRSGDDREISTPFNGGHDGQHQADGRAEEAYSALDGIESQNYFTRSQRLTARSAVSKRPRAGRVTIFRHVGRLLLMTK